MRTVGYRGDRDAEGNAEGNAGGPRREMWRECGGKRGGKCGGKECELTAPSEVMKAQASGLVGV